MIMLVLHACFEEGVVIFYIVITAFKCSQSYIFIKSNFHIHLTNGSLCTLWYGLMCDYVIAGLILC